MIQRNMIIFISTLIVLAVLMYLVRPPENLGVVSPVCVSEGGIVTCSYKVPMRSGTSTPCSIRSPSATSSIVHASADIRGAATSTLLTEIGKSTNSGATTTLLARLTIAANALGTLVATGTLNTDDNLVINPLNYVNVRFGLPSGFSSGSPGNCEVIFRVIS